MFDIEHRKGAVAIGHQIIRSKMLTEALASARRMAAKLGADHMTITDDRGDLVGVFQAGFRVTA